jgi:hypothetical protein
MARTAVVAGTATAVSNRVSRRQAGRWAQQEQPPPQQPPQQSYAPAPQDEPPQGEDRLEQLEKLGQLKAAGVLTEQEFQAEKARLLHG